MPCTLYKEARNETRPIFLLFWYKNSFELGFSTDGGRATTWMILLSCRDLVNFEYNIVGIYGEKISTVYYVTDFQLAWISNAKYAFKTFFTCFYLSIINKGSGDGVRGRVLALGGCWNQASIWICCSAVQWNWQKIMDKQTERERFLFCIEMVFHLIGQSIKIANLLMPV